MRHCPDLSLYLVLDRDLCGGTDGMVATARAAVAGGARMIQLRDKTASTEQMAATAIALRRALEGTGACLIVNDDIEAALAAQADGVHVGQSDTIAAQARAEIGPDRLLGVSVETEAAACAIDPGIVDYAGAGPVFATPTKADHKAPVGWDGLARMARACPVPSVAIGGIKAEHAALARQAGAAGIAVVSAICGQPDPEAAAQRLLATWQGAAR